MTMHDDDLARTADRLLADALSAAAAVMELPAGSSDAASAVPAKRAPRSWRRPRLWLAGAAHRARPSVAAIVLASVFAAAALKRPSVHQGPPGGHEHLQRPAAILRDRSAGQGHQQPRQCHPGAPDLRRHGYWHGHGAQAGY